MFIKSELVEKLKNTGLRWRFIAEYLKIDPRRKMFHEPQKKTRIDYIGLNLSKKLNNIVKERVRNLELIISEEVVTHYVPWDLKRIVDEKRDDAGSYLQFKNYLELGDIHYRLNQIPLYAGILTFDKLWEAEKENNEKSELKLTADEIYWLITEKANNHSFLGRVEFAPEIIDYRKEVKFLYKRGVKKHIIGFLYQLHEYGRIQSNSTGTLFHFEKYFKKLPKVNNGKKYKFNDEIKNKLIEFMEENKIPATIENAANMVKYLKKDINPNEAVKILVSVNKYHPEYLGNPIETIEDEYGRFYFDKRYYFSIYEEKYFG
ncbi:MAG: hypothetical protein ACYCTD_04680 [bacterium]